MLSFVSSISTNSDLESLADFSPNDVQVEKKIGEGYFSNVYVVVSVTTGEKMVKKEAKPDRDPAQLKNEMELLRELEHPNVISFYGEIIDYGSKAYKTEAGLFKFCSNGDLSQKIKLNGPIDISLAKKYTTELVTGLDYLHSKMILHRDLKAENVFIDENNSIKIADFGAAVKLGHGEKCNVLEGSPINLSPEMIKSEGYSYPRDWWSVGIIIFHMIVGRVPFEGKDELDLYMAILLKPPAYPIESEIPENVRDLINGLLQKNPESRFGSVDVFGHCWLNLDLEDEFSNLSFESDSLDTE